MYRAGRGAFDAVGVQQDKWWRGWLTACLHLPHQPREEAEERDEADKKNPKTLKPLPPSSAS